MQAFLGLVCEYLADLDADDGPERIQAEFEQARRDYAEAYRSFAPQHDAAPNSARSREQFEAWQLSTPPNCATEVVPGVVELEWRSSLSNQP